MSSPKPLLNWCFRKISVINSILMELLPVQIRRRRTALSMSCPCLVFVRIFWKIVLRIFYIVPDMDETELSGLSLFLFLDVFSRSSPTAIPYTYTLYFALMEIKWQSWSSSSLTFIFIYHLNYLLEVKYFQKPLLVMSVHFVAGKIPQFLDKRNIDRVKVT